MTCLRQYEYLVLEAPIREEADPGLPSQFQVNRFGQEGWMLSTIVRGPDRWFIYLMREVVRVNKLGLNRTLDEGED